MVSFLYLILGTLATAARAVCSSVANQTESSLVANVSSMNVGFTSVTPTSFAPPAPFAQLDTLTPTTSDPGFVGSNEFTLDEQAGCLFRGFLTQEECRNHIQARRPTAPAPSAPLVRRVLPASSAASADAEMTQFLKRMNCLVEESDFNRC